MERCESIKGKILELFELFLREQVSGTGVVIPLVSPWAVKSLADILEIDVVKEFFQVPNLKTFVKTFLLQFRLEGDIKAQEVQTCLEMVSQERLKHIEGRDDHDNEVNSYSKNVQIYCVECGLVAARYCTTCKDCLCGECCVRIHGKGSRANHRINKILLCSLCKNYPSRLQCTYTFHTFCIDCYTKRHAKNLPKSLDLKPLRIDYTLTQKSTNSWNSSRISLSDVLHSALVQEDVPEPHNPSVTTVVINGDNRKDWHPFLDSSGVTYYYNFRTQESVRRFEVFQQKPLPEQAPDDRLRRSVNKIKFDISPKVLCDQLTKAQVEIIDSSIS